MLEFNTKKPIQILWHRPLISRTNEELNNIFKIKEDTEIYKTKHYYIFTENDKKNIPVYGELFEIDRPSNLEVENNYTSEVDIKKILWQDKKCKLTDTEITIVIADQLLSKELQCELYTNLLCVRQIITYRSKVFGVNVSYINPSQCTIHMGEYPEII
jgi:DNA-binding GntR family transcriptional regulator